MKPIPLEPGAKFHEWEILREVPRSKSHRQAEARCSCGATKIISLASVRSGQSRSCGKCRQRMSTRKHGGWSTTEYTIWSQMKQRCYNEKNGGYFKYGGRGIRVCDRWKDSFAAFLEDVGVRPSMAHTLDRFPNNDGNYEIGNVRWATSEQQANNKRPIIWQRIVCLLAGDNAAEVIKMVAANRSAEEISRHIAATYRSS